MNKAVFLDRDGTINKEVNYLLSMEDFEFLPGAIEALKRLSATEYKIIVVTNQSGVGRGYFSEETLKGIDRSMCKSLAEKGARIDAVYYCPHRPGEGCYCRKPETGLLEKAKKDFGLDLKESYMVGDSTRDIKTGEKAGCKTILVKTGYAGGDKESPVEPDYLAKDLSEAADIIIASKPNNKTGKKYGTSRHA